MSVLMAVRGISYRGKDAIVAVGKGFLDEFEPEYPGHDHDDEHDARYDAEDGCGMEA